MAAVKGIVTCCRRQAGAFKLKTGLRAILTQTQTSARSAHSAATTVVAGAHFSAKGYGTKRAKDEKDEKDDGTLNDRIAALQEQRDGLKT